jgi:hypothetical protein
VKEEYNMSRTIVSFANATLRRDCIIGVVTIPGAYPGNPPRTRIVTPGSFPVDVSEPHDEVIRRWRGTEGDEAVRVQALEQELNDARIRLNNVKNILAGISDTSAVGDILRIVNAAQAQLEKP